MNDDDLLAEIEQEYLQPRASTGKAQLAEVQEEVARRKYGLSEVFSVTAPWLGATMRMVRSPVSGEYSACKEVEQAVETNAMSLQRAAGRPENYASGSSSQVPFQPGGMAAVGVVESGGAGLEREGELCTVPDGFDRGLFDVAGEGDVAGGSIELAAQYYGGEMEGDVEVGSSEAKDDVEVSSGEIVGDGKAVDDVDQLVVISKDEKELDRLGSSDSEAGKNISKRKEWAHVVDVAAGFSNFERLVPKLAREFPFELDVFQKRAVYHLERGDSVFIAAHTSAGKTVVAEYAVALSQLHMTKTIYTSPIKALSNQKFKDFGAAFGEENVGILTGDIKIRPEAACLIMTTEVLKNMLYRGADVLRDVEFVVFDECHYINDAERGVVWEEVIIMLPRHVSIILLSATVPNTKEFAEWVGRTKQRDMYVINTSKRPVPLEHYLYARTASKAQGQAQGQAQSKPQSQGQAQGQTQTQTDNRQLIKIVDKSGTFDSVAWREAYSVASKAEGGKGAWGSGANTWTRLVGMLRDQKLMPAVVFSFSRRKCEEFAESLRNMDFLNERRRSEVHLFVERSIKRLRVEDRGLPQVATMRALLKRGIGVHHSGLLPIIKEIVELLFARGLISCLFATETFAMGVNMPARSVVFAGLRKHDGRAFRDLLAGEYTQMAGRAGRRGLDATGVVIIDGSGGVPDAATLQGMLLGAATRLQSQFRLTYTMILNLLRAKQLRVEDVIRRSFGENAAQGHAPAHERRIVDATRQLDAAPPLACAICEDDVAAFHRVAAAAARLAARLLAMGSAGGLHALAPGRLALLSFFPHVVLGVVVARLAADGSRLACLVLNHEPAGAVGGAADITNVPDITDVPPLPTVDVAAAVAALNRPDFGYVCRAVPAGAVAVLLDASVKLGALGAARPESGSARDAARPVPAPLAAAIHAALAALGSRTADGAEFPWHRVRVLDVQEVALERRRLIGSAAAFQCRACPDLAAHFLATHARAALRAEVDALALQLSDQNLALEPDYRVRLDVLRALAYVDDDGNVLLKGRVACEMTSADELVLTELILDNSLARLEPEEIVALLSAFVCSERCEPPDLADRLPPALRAARERLLDVARRVASVQVAYGLPVAADEYVRAFRFGLMEVAYEWARGLSFVNIAALTDAQEGIVVRCIVRIADVLKNATAAAVLVGDSELKLKLHAAAELIRRDIVFAASLYF